MLQVSIGVPSLKIRRLTACVHCSLTAQTKFAEVREKISKMRPVGRHIIFQSY